LKISLRIDSAAAQAQLRRWGGEYRAKVRQAAARALERHGDDLRREVRGHVAEEMKVAKKAFLTSFTGRVINRDPNRLPALYVGSRIPWVGIHENGGAIAGKLLIPIYGARFDRKTFKKLVQHLVAAGNAYFVKNAKGHIVLMAENIAEHDKPLAGFKRRHRKATGVSRLKRGADIPIAVLVPRVAIPKRLDVQRVVTSSMPRLAATLQKQLSSLT
jgi:hypothetical protein